VAKRCRGISEVEGESQMKKTPEKEPETREVWQRSVGTATLVRIRGAKMHYNKRSSEAEQGEISEREKLEGIPVKRRTERHRENCPVWKQSYRAQG